MRFHYKTEPEELPEPEWIKLIQEYSYVRNVERLHFKNDMREVLYELAVRIYGKK